jgi:hypothetical protein
MNNNNTYSNIINPTKNNLLTHIHTFMEKIKESLTELKFKQFVENITKLINSLIDICIKNKINYFLQNNISFSSIKSNFMIELENILIIFINKIIPDIEKNFIDVSIDELNNIETYDQLNKTLIVLFKKRDNKNRVSFNPTATQYIYKDNIENTENTENTDKKTIKKTKKKSKSVKINLFGDNFEKVELPNIYKISLLIKIFFINNLNNVILQEKVFNMCNIINNISIEYDILQPYKNL